MKARSRHVLVHALVVMVALPVVLGSCSSDGEQASTPSTNPRATTTEPTEADVIAAYLGFWDAVFAAGSTSNPDHPDLVRFATGAQLETSRAVATSDKEAGVVTRRGDPPTSHQPEVRRLTSTTAVVVDCWLDTDVRYRASTGEVVDDRQVENYGEFRLVRADDEWKVERSEIRVLEEDESCEQLLV